jgi:transposase
MARFKPYRLDQLLLLPSSLYDFIPERHLARLVDRVVEKLETASIEDKYSELGQNTYHPKILIKLLFYGYAVGERSGRVIARRCETDTAYMYLAQMYRPDFRTINDFRKNNTRELSEYFVHIVRMCKELGLVRIGQINIDSTKMKANAANRRTKTRDEYQRWLKKVDDKIEKILEEADRVDAEEDEIYGDGRGDELPEDIDTEEKLRRKLEEVTKKFKAGKEKINLTDPDARFMKGGNGRIDIGYNCQAAVTNECLIVGSEVITDPNDRKALALMVETSEANSSEAIREVTADTGYSSYENDAYLSKKDKIGYIPDQQMPKDNPEGRDLYHQDQFTYLKERDEYICPEGHRLRRLKVRREDASYRKWRQVIYQGVACPTCPSKTLCTTQPYRTIARDDRKALREQMRARLRSEEGRQKYLKRLVTVEPIFGHLKHNLGYRQFLLRGLEKVRGEFRLMCIGYNLKKMNYLFAATGYQKHGG